MNDSKMKAAEAVAALDALMGQDDPEKDHAEADRILLAVAPLSVENAYNRLMERAKWWATA